MITDYQNFGFTYDMVNGFFPKEDSNEFNFYIRDKTIIQGVSFGDIELDYFQYSLVDKISNQIIAMIREEDDIYTCKNIKMYDENTTFSQKIIEDLSKIYLTTYKEDAFSVFAYDLVRGIANKSKPNYFIIGLYVFLVVLVICVLVLYWNLKYPPRINVVPTVEMTNVVVPVVEEIIPATRTNNPVILNQTQVA